MDSVTFEIEIYGLFSYFMRKKPTDGQVAMWFEETNHIPVAAAEWISGWIKREFDNIPRNMGKAFNAGWCLWPSKRTAVQDKLVPDKVTGRLRWYDDPDGTEYITFAEFCRRNPEYAEKWRRIKTMNAKGGNIEFCRREPGDEAGFQEGIPWS